MLRPGFVCTCNSITLFVPNLRSGSNRYCSLWVALLPHAGNVNLTRGACNVMSPMILVLRVFLVDVGLEEFIMHLAFPILVS